MRRRDGPRSLTLPQHFALVAAGFDGPQGQPFESREDALDAWDEHRDRLIARCQPGERPWAFWAFDVGQPELVWPAPGEAIDWAEWVDDDSRPLVESPRRTEAQIVAGLEREARERRLDHHRRDYLERSRRERKSVPVLEAPRGRPTARKLSPPPTAAARCRATEHVPCRAAVAPRRSAAAI